MKRNHFETNYISLKAHRTPLYTEHLSLQPCVSQSIWFHQLFVSVKQKSIAQLNVLLLFIKKDLEMLKGKSGYNIY